MSERKAFLRFADEDDCKDLYDWRNDALSVQFSLSGKLGSYAEHKKWYKKKLRDPMTQIFILVDDKAGKIGMVRFDKSGKEVIVSININPEFRGKGYGTYALAKAIRNYFDNFEIESIMAEIKQANEASLKIFGKCGFKEVSKKEDVLKFKLTKDEFDKIWNKIMEH
jgi:spore coat polysaccharide biosynthesis protein SpsF